MTGGSVWITGAGGLIGSWLVKTAPDSADGLSVLGLTRPDLDLADFAAVKVMLSRHPPKAIIHCAALSRSPECQANPVFARKLNVEVTRFLVDSTPDIPVVFFSTDLVFNGLRGNYQETDAPNPMSVYAETKLEAEQFVLRNPRHTVVRTSLNAGKSPAGNRGLEEQLLLASKSGKPLKLFTDEFRCPIPAESTARAVWELLKGQHAGLYHVAGAERLSRWQIAQLLAVRRPDLEAKFEPGSLRDYAGAPRSPDTSLNCTKVQRLLSFALPRFSDWVGSPAFSI